MDAKYNRLCVARASGKLQIYCLPQPGLLQKIEVAGFHPFQVLYNPTGSKLALLDLNGTLRFGYNVDSSTKLKVDRDPVNTGILEMLWSKDMPDYLAVLKRTEMAILHHSVIERFENVSVLTGRLVEFDVRMK